MSSAHPMKLSIPSDRELVITRVFDAPRKLVFDAWTNPKYLPQWLLGPDGWTMPVCEVDLREGGTWHFVWRSSDGAEMDMRGTYREIHPPERIVSVESWGGNWPETVNTLVLTEEGGQTISTMTILYASREAREAAMQTGMDKGMEMSFRHLEQFLISAGASGGGK